VEAEGRRKIANIAELPKLTIEKAKPKPTTEARRHGEKPENQVIRGKETHRQECRCHINLAIA
jgi:hypothetical protein